MQYPICRPATCTGLWVWSEARRNCFTRAFAAEGVGATFILRSRSLGARGIGIKVYRSKREARHARPWLETASELGFRGKIRGMFNGILGVNWGPVKQILRHWATLAMSGRRPHA